MKYCYSGTESLWYGSWNRHVCRKGKFAADRSTGVNPSRKQSCCSPSCLWSQAQRGTSDQDNSQNLGYWLTIRNRCICMWSWPEMLIFSFQLRAKIVWIPLPTSTEICRLGEGHNLCPSECRLSVCFPIKEHFLSCSLIEGLGNTCIIFCSNCCVSPTFRIFSVIPWLKQTLKPHKSHFRANEVNILL